MKSFSFLFVVILLFSSCKKEEETTCSGAECNYTLSANETAGALPASLDGTYNLTSDYEQPGSPFRNGTIGTFTLAGNVLTVEILGEACITLRNPYQTTPSEIIFVDDCRDNLKYAVSQALNGNLNEVNIGSLNSAFYCQFK